MKPDTLKVSDCSVGRGLFAGRAYRPGELIVVFGGSRFDRNHAIHETESGANLLQTGWRTYILPEPPAVFANHSCNPNAGLVNSRRLVAIRPIAENEEIRFDYSTTMAENFWTMNCRCGDAACRKVVTDFKYLPPEVQTRYLKLGIVPKFIASRYRLRDKGFLHPPHRSPLAPSD